ncbi:hypothetical protein B7463_g775, partial [Scytalidium lignicola]
MKLSVSTLLAASVSKSLASIIPSTSSTGISSANTHQSAKCQNTPTSRSCWGDYSIDTDYYAVTPHTRVTREYWLSVENVTIAPDGYSRYALTFNGTIPGPPIIADWGDNLYHAHFTTQYGDGLLGPIVLNGPATADYDEDLGMLFLSDWSHIPTSELWDIANHGPPATINTGLINGINTWDCINSTDANCVGGGKKFEITFVSGKKYRIRIVNSAVEAFFQFSIDGHKLTVIGNDFVPIVPYETDSVVINMGQRYDLIVEANAVVDNYWIRAGWIPTCSVNNDNPLNITGIVRYNSSSTENSTTTSSVVIRSNCGDEPLASLVPHLPMDMGHFSDSNVIQEDLNYRYGTNTTYFTWNLNNSALLLNWTTPTILRLFNHETICPTNYNVVLIDEYDAGDEWALVVIQDISNTALPHPFHLHGHDFLVVGQDTGYFNIANTTLNRVNPPRRDVASVPGNGYLAIAFKMDNPGSWLFHCHIAWHASEGLVLQFVEREKEILATFTDPDLLKNNCAAWDTYTINEMFPQEDSGI